MFTLTTVTEPTKLDEIIDALTQKMTEAEYGTAAYTEMANSLTQLYKAKEIDTNIKTKIIETYGKQNEIEAKIVQQAADVENKKLESESNLALKRAEIDSNRLLKAEELALRLKEVDATVELRGAETELKKVETEVRKRVSPETWAIIGSNIAAVLLIIGHERLNVVTSKALSFVSKLK